MSAYGDKATEAWLRWAWKKSGKKLDLGKSCIRFEKLEDAPMDVIGELFARVPVKDYVARVQAVTGKGQHAKSRKRS